ncbi:low molecular weight protein-tyrosine-phosphatase [Austwickia chelonae]|uniref:low molecular weight protein-tyrosine-phosphatase n=1 Tax=Austwickia chelonae TaxID=100225 RepID=UPI000E25D378|nr:low molecular weight protein-tyrosine-phosphatase [Austwickia chelonae]
MTSPYRVCVICSGNICRSPMGEVVLRESFAQAGMSERVVVDSAGTGPWHVGEGADPRALSTLAAAGYDGSSHRAREYDVAWLTEHDLVLAADEGHLRTLRRWADEQGYQVGPQGDVDIRLFREFDPAALSAGTVEIDDPYYGGQDGFDRVLAEVVAASQGVVAHVTELLTD